MHPYLALSSLPSRREGRSVARHANYGHPEASRLLGKVRMMKKNFDKDSETDPCIRAENEDDDGYDPYSDRREVEPLFEEDPWR